MKFITSFNQLKSNYIRNSFNLYKRHLSIKNDLIVIKMPSLSPTMTQGTISAWRVNPGEEYKVGSVLCEVETDKASVAFEVQEDQVLAKILVDAQAREVKVGEPIALAVEDLSLYQKFLKADPSEYASLINATAAPAAATPAPAPVAAPTPAAATPAPVATSTTIPENVLLAPAAKFLIHNLHLDPTQIKGTGKHGMITKEDIKLYLKHGGVSIPVASVQSVAPVVSQATTAPTSPKVASTPSSAAPSFKDFAANDKFKDIPTTSMRKIIAKRLSESKSQNPHFYTIMECNVDSILKLRKDLKNQFDANVSVNDVVIKAAALALRDVPEANARWNPATNKIISQKSIDISVAVATPTGLITPIVAHADKRSLLDINHTVKDLAGRAKDNKLKPEEFQGGTFSVSNLGMFGVTYFSAVINPPQACILAIGTGVPRVIPPSPTDKVQKPKVINTVSVQLSADRRVIDEAIAAQFLQAFKSYLSNSTALLL